MTLKLLAPIAGAVFIALGFSISIAAAQDRGACTVKCGGRPGGEAANTPSAIACFRKCMGVRGNSDRVGKQKPCKRDNWVSRSRHNDRSPGAACQ